MDFFMFTVIKVNDPSHDKIKVSTTFVTKSGEQKIVYGEGTTYCEAIAVAKRRVRYLQNRR